MPIYRQRIYDSGLGQYVIYALPNITTSPAAAQTTPNHTGSLVAATHEVYSIAEPGSVLWEWNGVDLTQFDQVGDAGFAASVTTWNTRFGTVLAIEDESPAIQINNPAGAGLFFGLLIKTTEFDLTKWPSCIIECRMSNRTAAGTQDLLVVPYYENTTHFHALRHTSAADSLTMRNGSATYADRGNIQFYTTDDVGEPISMQFNILDFASALQAPRVRQERTLNVSSNPRIIQYLRQSAYAVSWTALGTYVPRIGFGCRTFGAAAAPGNLIANIRIRAPF